MMRSFDEDEKGFLVGDVVDVSDMVVKDCKEFKKDVMRLAIDYITSDNSLGYRLVSKVLLEVVAKVDVMAEQSDRIDEILEGMSI